MGKRTTRDEKDTLRTRKIHWLMHRVAGWEDGN